MSFNFVGQFKALIFLSKHHWQMCLVHEIDQRIICKKSYGQSVAMISLHDIPIHLFRIQRKRLMMNCSITTINTVWRAFLMTYEVWPESYYSFMFSANIFWRYQLWLYSNRRAWDSQDFTCTFAHRSEKDHVFKIGHSSWTVKLTVKDGICFS
jgi:hypothetical protein